jgi:hypothetical protein
MNEYFILIIPPLFTFVLLCKTSFALILTVATIRKLIVTKTFSIKVLFKTLLCALCYVLMVRKLWQKLFSKTEQADIQ